MNIAGADEVSEILDRVRRWPTPSRITLARRILESIDPSVAAETGPDSPARALTRGVPAESVVGLLRAVGEPPDLEECRQVVEEERWKKYGP
jgi:hypothetical protein